MMLHLPTFALLAATLSAAPSVLAADNDDTSATGDNHALESIDNGLKVLDRAFIPFKTTSERNTPPLTPSMIPGGPDERAATDVHILTQGATPLVAQDRPYRAVDGYRQYSVHLAGGAEDSTGWSESDWSDYGRQFHGATLGPDGFDPVQRIRVRQYFVDGPVRFENEQGRTLFEGYNAFISDRATLRTGAFLFTLEPELRLHNTARTGYDPRYNAALGFINTQYGVEDRNGLEIMEATAQVDVFGAHLTVGRQSLVWGPGIHQQLLLSENAAPMWMVHLTTSEPMALPGMASKLGYFSPEVFFARLDSDRPVPNIWLSGVRLGWQVNPYVKLGINLVSTFGGKGQSMDTSDLFFNLTSSNGDSLPNGTSDQKCSWDFRVLSPWKAAPFELYMENGYETRAKWSDITSLHKGWLQPAWLAGFRLPKLDKDGIFSATFEYAWTGPHWYIANRADLSGGAAGPGKDYMYSYQGQNIGAPMGGDADSFWGELRAKVHTGIETFASFGYENHGKSAPVTEQLFQTKIGADIDLVRATGLFRGWHAEGTLGWDRWTNFQGVRDNTQNGVAIGLELRRGF